MPTKQKNGKPYKIDGKVFTWTSEDGDEIQIPLRIKMKVLRAIPSGDLDSDGMFAILDRIIPDQADALDEMDVNDFVTMFTTWQEEYQKLSGASLGE